MAEYLMTDPAHYAVGYEINPWMAPKVWGKDPARHAACARAAWASLKAALEHAGASVHVARGAPDLPDMVFAANSAVVLDGRALVANFRHPERAGERAAYLSAFDALVREGTLAEATPIEGVFQEGAGDAIWDAHRQLFWAGYGQRSDLGASRIIADHFGARVVPLELADPRYYHLDTCFCPLPGGEVVYYPAAFTPAALRRIRDIVCGAMLIEATPADAAAFAVNAVSLARRVIMAKPTPYLRDRIAERGYCVVELDLSPFLLAGGAAFCMTLRLDHQSLPARVAQRQTEIA